MLTKDELTKTSPLYDANLAEWNYNQMAYDGGETFVNDALVKEARESDNNWAERKARGICFNYAKSIVNIYSFYLNEQHPVRDLGGLQDDELFNMFEEDCDQYGTNFEQFIIEAQKLSSVAGAVGILVDKPVTNKKNLTREAAKADKIYPYCSAYTLPNIINWEVTRDPVSGKLVLSSLTLREPDNSYLVWTRARWERYSINTDAKAKKDEQVVLDDSGKNPLGIIPFLWLQNIRSISRPHIGVSDITEISRITASIIRDISCGDEVIKYAGFPMLRKPQRSTGDTSADVSGVTAVLEFDPEQGDGGKPDWLEAPTKEPMDAITNWINTKIAEMFQAAHLSGVHAHETSSNVRSGVSMRYEFQQLSRVLAAKSTNMNEAELRIIEFFILWQGLPFLMKDIIVSRPNDFSVDDLSMTLENLDIASASVNSLTFQKELQKTIVRKTVSDATTSLLNTMYEEIDENTTELPKKDTANTFSKKDEFRQDLGYNRANKKPED